MPAFIPQDMLAKKEEEYTLEQLEARIEELQRQMMSLTKTGFDEREYSTLAREIDLMRERGL